MEHKTSNGIKFEYEEYTFEKIDSNETVHVYNKLKIIKSENPEFEMGDKIEQISISEKIFFENEDGTKYIKKLKKTSTEVFIN